MSSQHAVVETLVVSDPRALAFLHSSSHLDLIGCLIDRDYGIAELAAKLEASIQSTAYRVKRMAQLGLAQCTGQVARHGRPIKRYRSTARSFVLQAEDSSLEGLLEFQRARYAPFFDQILRAQVAHMQAVARRRHGRAVVRLVYDKASERTTSQWMLELAGGRLSRVEFSGFQNAWGTLRLRPAAMHEFMREMSDLLARYLEAEPPEGRQLVFAGVVMPIVPEER